jgi:hypothetical protein
MQEFSAFEILDFKLLYGIARLRQNAAPAVLLLL